jgi:ribosomal protein L19E
MGFAYSLRTVDRGLRSRHRRSGEGSREVGRSGKRGAHKNFFLQQIPALRAAIEDLSQRKIEE